MSLILVASNTHSSQQIMPFIIAFSYQIAPISKIQLLA